MGSLKNTTLPVPPGVTVMTVGEARAEFSDPNLGEALSAWGNSPAVPRDPDDYWCWVLEGGLDIRTRFKTQEEATEDAWRVLWVLREAWGSEEEKRQVLEDMIAVLRERGCGFPERYKARCRSTMNKKEEVS